MPRRRGRRERRAAQSHVLEREMLRQRGDARLCEQLSRERRTRAKELASHARNTAVHVTNLPYATLAGEVVSLFSQFGAIVRVDLAPNREHPGQCRGRGIVSFATREECLAAAPPHPVPLRLRGRLLRVVQDRSRRGLRCPNLKAGDCRASRLEMGTLLEGSWLLAWSAPAKIVRVRVDGQKRRVCVFAQISGVEFKMDIYMKDIVHAELQRLDQDPCGHALLLQSRRPPRLFEKKVLLTDHRLCWETETDADSARWERATDMTGSHSTTMGEHLDVRFVFEDASLKKLQSLIRALQTYRCLAEPLRVASAPALSRAPPRPARPPAGVSFEVLYELEVLVGCGLVQVAQTRHVAFAEALRLYAPAVVVAALRQMLGAADVARIRDPVTELWRWCETLSMKTMPASDEASSSSSGSPSSDAAPVSVRRVAVSPLRVSALPPEHEVSNRVLREVPVERMIRVSFTEENLSSIAPQARSDAVLNRVRAILQDGLELAGRRFEFLAYGSSQLKNTSCWFVQRDDKSSSHQFFSATAIRARMGDFSAIRQPGKYAARMGQCFSTTVVGLPSMAILERRRIPDVERNGYCFSDGCGTISAAAMGDVAARLGLESPPSALQIRMGGVKGMVVLDPSLRGSVICTRPSMDKFPSKSTALEVCRPATAGVPGFLNRQLITLLSSRGVPDAAFERLQASMTCEIDAMMDDPTMAKAVLRRLGAGPWEEMALGMLDANLTASNEYFLASLLRATRAHLFQELRQRARIHVPESCMLLGVLDETATLRSGTIFVQRSSQGGVVLGPVVVARNPCLHPGDILVLEAVETAALRHLFDVVVFPQLGRRPHPDESSGGDLDGDSFFISWDRDLLPTSLYSPASFAPAVAPPARTVTMDTVRDFFTDFMKSDRLGMIANAHLAIADQSQDGAYDPRCLELAELHSTAVDFPKTGVPAELARELTPKEYPDFMAKKDKPTYVSKRVLGALYRSVRAPSFARDTPPSYRAYDELLDYYMPADLRDGDHSLETDVLDDALRLREDYNLRLSNLMNQYGVHDEGQIISGQILKFYRRYAKSKRKYDVRLQVAAAIKDLRRWVREQFDGAVQRFQEHQRDPPSTEDSSLYVASMWYYATYHEDNYDENDLGLRSFPWLAAHDPLVRIRAASAREPAQLAALSRLSVH